MTQDYFYFTNPKDYYFQFYNEDLGDNYGIAITPKEYYDEEKVLLDTSFEIDIRLESNGIIRLSDSTYAFNGSKEDARHILLKLGLEEHQMVDKYGCSI